MMTRRGRGSDVSTGERRSGEVLCAVRLLLVVVMFDLLGTSTSTVWSNCMTNEALVNDLLNADQGSSYRREKEDRPFLLRTHFFHL